MNKQDQRIKKIEQRMALNEEDQDPIFDEWMGNPWLPEEQADVLARHPDCDAFYKHMLPHDLPYRHDPDQPVLRTLNGTRYGARKMTPEERKHRQKFERALSPAEEERRQNQIQRIRDYMDEVAGLPPRPGKEVEPIQFKESRENPWTEEEKADVLARHPECDWFLKADSPGRMYGAFGMGHPVLRTLDGTPYEAEKKTPYAIWSLEDAKRMG